MRLTNNPKADYIIVTATLIIFLTLIVNTAMAQLPDTKTNIVYSVSGTTIYNYNPVQPVESGINPMPNKITLPEGAKSLAVCKNLNGKNPAKTFYTIVSGIYYYYDGGKWISTDHSCGNSDIVNMSAGDNYIYSFTSNANQILIYNGKENSTLLTKVDFGSNLAEVFVKNDYGKFFLLKSTESQPMSSSGSMSSKTGASGLTNLSIGGNFAIINGSMYVTSTEEFNAGSNEGNSIIFESANISQPPSALQN